MKQDMWKAPTADDIEIKYREFLSKLKNMPTDTAQDKEDRKQAVISYPELNDFVEDLLHAYKPPAYEKLMKHLGISDTYPNQEAKDSLWDNVHTDPGLFYEAILSAAEYYTGQDSSGNPVSFLASVGFKFKQMANMQYAKESVESTGKIPDIAENRIAKIYKLAMSVKELKESGVSANFENVLDSLDSSKNITKKEREAVLLIASGQYKIKEMDAPANNEDQDTKWGELIPDKNNEFKKLEERESTLDMLKSFFLHWDNMDALFKKREKECIRIFLTKDILQPLKMDSHNEPYLDEPAGNPDIFELLSPYESVVYGKIFYKDYVDYAITGKPEDLYDVYANLLRKGFQFSDKEIAEALDRDKTYVSKRHKLYKELQITMKNYCYSLDNVM